MADQKAEFNQQDIDDANGPVNTTVDGSKTRLCVDALLSPGETATPGQTITDCQFLANSGSIAMDVNGAGTPVVFEWVAPTGQTWYVTKMSLSFWDSEIKNRNNFGAVGSLSNGVLYEAELSATSYEIVNLKTNSEIMTLMRTDYNDGDTGNNWGAGAAVATAFLEISPPIKLAPGDKIKATVRDNIGGLNRYYSSICKWREI